MSKKNIVLSGTIGTGENQINAAWFRQQLEDAKGQDIILEINSKGGDVSEMFEMAKVLERYKGHSEAQLLPDAMSSMSAFCCYADTTTVYPESCYMLHCSSFLTLNDAEGLRSDAETLDQYDEQLCTVYMRKSQKSHDVVMAEMKSTTYYFSDTIKTMGKYADTFVDSEDVVLRPAALEAAKDRFAKFAAFYRLAAVAKAGKGDKRVKALQEWIRINPDNPLVEAVVNEGIANGKTTEELQAQLLVAARDGITNEDRQSAAAVHMSIKDYLKYKL